MTLIKKLEIISIFRYHQQNLFILKVVEVSFFRVDEFVKFDEFNKKLPVHIQWLDGWLISQIYVPIYDYYW